LPPTPQPSEQPSRIKSVIPLPGRLAAQRGPRGPDDITTTPDDVILDDFDEGQFKVGRNARRPRSTWIKSLIPLPDRFAVQRDHRGLMTSPERIDD
jgi:hypothetical protein